RARRKGAPTWWTMETEHSRNRIPMDASLRGKLRKLRDLTENSLAADSKTDIPVYVREAISLNVITLLEKDASHQEIGSKLIGGLRTIADASPTNDDDPVTTAICRIIEMCGQRQGKDNQ
ncbi:MAG: hypothetical protein KDA63_14430, partial [Planctomycetales bacterium]|nr:hypothetical protein [Planctomycetales bacterium]